MGLVFYLFTILILLVCVGAGSIALSAYFVSRNRIFKYAVFFFVFYLFDVVLIFQGEFTNQNLDFAQEHFYSVEYPYLRIALSVGALESLLLIMLDYLDEERLAFKVVPPVLFCVASIAIILFYPEGQWQQMWFYTMRQVFLLGCAVYIAFRYTRSKNEFYRMRLGRYKKLYVIAIMLVFMVLLEDYWMIIVWDPNFNTSLLPLYISQRNFSENFLMLIVAFFIFRAGSNTLRLRFHEPPDPQVSSNVQTRINELLPVYCVRHDLTNREKDILLLILNNKDTQNIASELHLAAGTVKAHVHNILHKTGHETRRELIKEFWRE